MADEEEPEELYTCPHTTDEEPHPCPYRQDIFNDDDTFCRCCDVCAYQCAMDV